MKRSTTIGFITALVLIAGLFTAAVITECQKPITQANYTPRAIVK